MRTFLGLACIFAFARMEAVPQLPIQELKASISQLEYQCHSQKVELNILSEKIDALEASLSSAKKNDGEPKTLEKRLCTLEKTQERLNDEIAQCKQKLNDIDKQVTQDLKSVKSSLQSMISYLQKEDMGSDGKYYVVKSGDSLGQIALDHRTDIKKLRELNQLKGDRIFAGQKLKLPD